VGFFYFLPLLGGHLPRGGKIVGPRTMLDCATCDHLLADYKHTIRLFKDAVQKLPGTGEDSSLAVVNADCLLLKCREANDALIEHWRAHHGSTDAGS
jgi:hypothetical protein